MAYLLTAVSYDCGATTSTTGHPRNWGAYPRFLGLHVLQQKLVSWGEAVRKMTALPATMIGMTERGYLLPGMIADVTVFDPATVIDRATIDAPTAPSVGIDTVVVGGRLALDDGRATGAPVGRALRRAPHEPGRPMSLAARSLRIDGAGISVRLEQRAGAARPSGTLGFAGLPGAPVRFAPSLLQTADGWASVTGVGTWPDGGRRAVTLVADAADPFRAGRPSLTMLADGRQIAETTLRPGTIDVGSTPARRR